MIARWKERRFEAAVGSRDNDLRLAMNARRELATIARGSGTETAKWLRIMGNIPLRRVVEGAFGLPPSFARLDLDRQVDMLRDRARSVLGEGGIGQLTQPDKVDRLIRRYLVATEIRAAGQATDVTGLFRGGLLRRL